MGKQYVQGDMFFEEITGPVSATYPVNREEHHIEAVDGIYVIAKGEKTGHAHVFSAEDGEMRATNTQRVLIVDKDNAEVRHDEHPPLQLPHVLYEVKRQREFDYKSHYHRVVED